jgi:hypothetical protein
MRVNETGMFSMTNLHYQLRNRDVEFEGGDR